MSTYISGLDYASFMRQLRSLAMNAVAQHEIESPVYAVYSALETMFCISASISDDDGVLALHPQATFSYDIESDDIEKPKIRSFRCPDFAALVTYHSEGGTLPPGNEYKRPVLCFWTENKRLAGEKMRLEERMSMEAPRKQDMEGIMAFQLQADLQQLNEQAYHAFQMFEGDEHYAIYGLGIVWGLLKYTRMEDVEGAGEAAEEESATSPSSIDWWKFQPEVVYFGEYLFTEDATALNPLLLKALADIGSSSIVEFSSSFFQVPPGEHCPSPSSIMRGTKVVESCIQEHITRLQQLEWVETGAYGDDKTPQKERLKPVSEYRSTKKARNLKAKAVSPFRISLRPRRKDATASAEHSPQPSSSQISAPSTPKAPSNRRKGKGKGKGKGKETETEAGDKRKRGFESEG